MTQPAMSLIDEEPANDDLNFGNTRTLLAALRNHYIGPEPLPGGVFLTELPIPDGPTVRRADALYLSFTQARGIGIDVCEVKVSRADFQRELADPRKADAWWQYSTRFWIVSPGPDVTPPDLLPEGWGLMCPKRRGRRFQVLREPAVRNPHVDLVLLIEIAKRLDTLRATAESNARLQADYEWRQKLYEVQQQKQEATLTEDQQERLAVLAKLEELAGVHLDQWRGPRRGEMNPEQFARALRLAARVVVEEQQAAKHLEYLRRTASSIGNIHAQLAEHIDAATAALTEHQQLTSQEGGTR